MTYDTNNEIVGTISLYVNIIFFQKKIAHHLPYIPELYTLMFNIYFHVVVVTDRNMSILTTFSPFRKYKNDVDSFYPRSILRDYWFGLFSGFPEQHVNENNSSYFNECHEYNYCMNIVYIELYELLTE